MRDIIKINGNEVLLDWTAMDSIGEIGLRMATDLVGRGYRVFISLSPVVAANARTGESTRHLMSTEEVLNTPTITVEAHSKRMASTTYADMLEEAIQYIEDSIQHLGVPKERAGVYMYKVMPTLSSGEIRWIWRGNVKVLMGGEQ